jgi:hypothetical protein
LAADAELALTCQHLGAMDLGVKLLEFLKFGIFS